MENKSLIFRYLIIIILLLVGFKVLNELFLPITIYPIYYLLEIFYDGIIRIPQILIGARTIEIIPACVSAGAYFLLLMLNLTTPDQKIKTRILSIIFSFGLFLLINILRIFILSVLYLEGATSFEILHELLWYLGSSVIIVLIWFLTVKIFKIEKYPGFTDVTRLYKKSIFTKKKITKK